MFSLRLCLSSYSGNADTHGARIRRGQSRACYHGATNMNPSRPVRKRSRQYRKTGAYALIRTLKRHGIEGLDGRSTLAREARDYRARRAEDLGGADAVSAAQAELLDTEAVQVAIVRHVAGILAAQPGWIVNRRRRRLSDLAHDFNTAVRALRETVLAVADPRLQRVQKPTPSLAEILRHEVETGIAASQAQAEENAPERGAEETT